MNRSLMFFALSGVMVLSACGDKPQVMQTYKSDIPAFQGATGPYTTTGWKAGDKASWEQGLKARLQNTQNEYNKLPLAK
ncbi:MAG: putative lipoprotein [Polaromonas sp.]|jgi:hypothetical protein|nr:putative lipoprotein [Polaromonas sp.]